jgi:hypothetical protein
MLKFFEKKTPELAKVTDHMISEIPNSNINTHILNMESPIPDSHISNKKYENKLGESDYETLQFNVLFLIYLFELYIDLYRNQYHLMRK